MFIKKIKLFTLVATLIGVSACTHNEFNVLHAPDVNAQPKTPGYYNPNEHNYAMPQNQQPIIENQFYWKDNHDKTAVAPDE
ncbi:hypothetical protein [Fastidiosibacter lacustris]|uniref:hypothetical protein n=1 Tax=Fastidiosibacter lacustris TaxID=2056695 RepID=UPI000E3556C0|nr:hypothetical protein [Fastidiosibacter lacustris]